MSTHDLADKLGASVRVVAEEVVANEQRIEAFVGQLCVDLQQLYPELGPDALAKLAHGLCDWWLAAPQQVAPKAPVNARLRVARSDVPAFLESAKAAFWPQLRQMATLHRSRMAARR